MKFLAVAGRQPLISLAEIKALYDKEAYFLRKNLIVFNVKEDARNQPHIDRLGGTMKLAKLFDGDFANLIKFINETQPTGKITLGISGYTEKIKQDFILRKSMELKRSLVKMGRSVRIVTSKDPEISSATAHHNKLGRKLGCFEFLLIDREIYLSLGTQNITTYAERDQTRPARDAKVGMLPPKLAQILLNLCGFLPFNSRILDPFCGTGVVLQEATIMGYLAIGSDLNERMVEYARKNLHWLFNEKNQKRFNIDPTVVRNKTELEHDIVVGDATNYIWEKPINAVVFEGFLGSPMSKIPAEMKFKTEKTRCKKIILDFLRNIAPQISTSTPIVMAIPAWLREDGRYARLEILDEIAKMEYNFEKFRGIKQSDLLYYREGQIVAREIIVLRKK